MTIFSDSVDEVTITLDSLLGDLAYSSSFLEVTNVATDFSTPSSISDTLIAETGALAVVQTPSLLTTLSSSETEVAIEELTDTVVTAILKPEYSPVSDTGYAGFELTSIHGEVGVAVEINTGGFLEGTLETSTSAVDVASTTIEFGRLVGEVSTVVDIPSVVFTTNITQIETAVPIDLPDRSFNILAGVLEVRAVTDVKNISSDILAIVVEIGTLLDSNKSGYNLTRVENSSSIDVSLVTASINKTSIELGAALDINLSGSLGLATRIETAVVLSTESSLRLVTRSTIETGAALETNIQYVTGSTDVVEVTAVLDSPKTVLVGAVTVLEKEKVTENNTFGFAIGTAETTQTITTQSASTSLITIEIENLNTTDIEIGTKIFYPNREEVATSNEIVLGQSSLLSKVAEVGNTVSNQNSATEFKVGNFETVPATADQTAYSTQIVARTETLTASDIWISLTKLISSCIEVSSATETTSSILKTSVFQIENAIASDIVATLASIVAKLLDNLPIVDTFTSKDNVYGIHVYELVLTKDSDVATLTYTIVQVENGEATAINLGCGTEFVSLANVLFAIESSDAINALLARIRTYQGRTLSPYTQVPGIKGQGSSFLGVVTPSLLEVQTIRIRLDNGMIVRVDKKDIHTLTPTEQAKEKLEPRAAVLVDYDKAFVASDQPNLNIGVEAYRTADATYFKVVREEPTEKGVVGVHITPQ
jgi:hypothetical protein